MAVPPSLIIGLFLIVTVSGADLINNARINVTFSPAAIQAPYFPDNGLPWGDTTEVIVMVQLLRNPMPAEQYIGQVQMSWQCEDTDVCLVLNQNHMIKLDDPDTVHTFNLTIRADFLGKTELKLLNAHDMTNTGPVFVEMQRMPINVLRTAQSSKLNNLFTGFIIIFVVINTFMMGTQLRFSVIVSSVKKPIGPIIGFMCQYVLMPMLAFGFAMLFLRRWPSLQFGYFAIGCSPGGGGSNFWTLLLDGNLDLSVTMTFFSNAAALIMMPAWLYTVGTYFYDGDLVLPFANIVISLLSLLIPAGIGLVVGHWKPLWVPKFKTAVKIFTLVVLICIIGLSSWINLYIFSLLRWYTLIPGFLLPWTAYALSYSIARYLGQSHQNCRTIAIETGIQNAAVAILVCQLSLPAPDNDLTLVMPISVLMFTGIPLWIWLPVRAIREQCFGYVDPDLIQDEAEKRDKLVEYQKVDKFELKASKESLDSIEKVELICEPHKSAVAAMV